MVIQETLMEFDKEESDPEELLGDLDVTVYKSGIRIDWFGPDHYCEISYTKLKLLVKKIERLREKRENGQQKLT